MELEAEKYKNNLHTDFYLKSKNDDRRLGFGKHFLLFSIAESNVENYLYRRVFRSLFFSNFVTLFPSYMSKLERSNDALKTGHLKWPIFDEKCKFESKTP